MAVPPRIVAGKLALPDIAGKKGIVIRLVITPGKANIAKPAARGMFPFRLGGKPPACLLYTSDAADE